MHKEAEDFEQEFYPKSGQFAIIDASVLDSVPNSAKQDAILISSKNDDVLFVVKAEYDDSVLRSLSITPSTYNDEGDVKEPSHIHTPEIGKGIDLDKDGNKVIVDEGKRGEESRSHGPHKNNHDSPLRRRSRISRKSRRHMKGKEEHGAKDPERVIGGKINAASKRKLSRIAKRNHRTSLAREEVAKFLIGNMGHTIAESDLKNVENIDYLLDVLGSMVSICAGSEKNESSKVLDFDWIYNTKQLVESVHKCTTSDAAQILMESIDGRRSRST